MCRFLRSGTVIPGGFLVVCVILGLQAVASKQMSVAERAAAAPELEQIPWRIGRWKAQAEGSLDNSMILALKPDAYVLRDYADPSSGSVMNLFVGYFQSRQNAYGPHSPRICLPGAGWLVRSARIGEIAASETQRIPVNEYMMENGTRRIMVLYWYQNERAAWAEEFHAKLMMLPDLLRYRRSDVSLIRLVTPLEGSAARSELSECHEFARALYPAVTDILRAGDSGQAKLTPGQPLN